MRKRPESAPRTITNRVEDHNKRYEKARNEAKEKGLVVGVNVTYGGKIYKIVHERYHDIDTNSPRHGYMTFGLSDRGDEVATVVNATIYTLLEEKEKANKIKKKTLKAHQALEGDTTES